MEYFCVFYDIIEMSYPNWTSPANWNVSPTPEPPLEGKLMSDGLDLGYVAGQVTVFEPSFLNHFKL